eukprot:5404706-Amphidinium_carterae.1
MILAWRPLVRASAARTNILCLRGDALKRPRHADIHTNATVLATMRATLYSCVNLSLKVLVRQSPKCILHSRPFLNIEFDFKHESCCNIALKLGGCAFCLRNCGPLSRPPSKKARSKLRKEREDFNLKYIRTHLLYFSSS